MTTYPAPNPPMISARHHGGSQAPKAIVMHATVSSDNAGTARNIANWWHGASSPDTSAHYVVDPAEVIQCVGDHTIAYHCGYNTGSIGVELCDEEQGPASRWADADSTAILERAAVLVAQLCLAYDISPKRPSIADLKAHGPHGIYGHDDSRQAFGYTTHTDPEQFPWAKFLRLVRAAMTDQQRAAAAPQHHATKTPTPTADTKAQAVYHPKVDQIAETAAEGVKHTSPGSKLGKFFRQVARLAGPLSSKKG